MSRTDEGQPTLPVLVHADDFPLRLSALDNLVVAVTLVLEHPPLVLQSPDLVFDVSFAANNNLSADHPAVLVSGDKDSERTTDVIGFLDALLVHLVAVT